MTPSEKRMSITPAENDTSKNEETGADEADNIALKLERTDEVVQSPIVAEEVTFQRLNDVTSTFKWRHFNV